MSGSGKKPDRFQGRALPHRPTAQIGVLYNTLLLSLPNSFLAVFCCCFISAIDQPTSIYGSNEEEEKQKFCWGKHNQHMKQLKNKIRSIIKYKDDDSDSKDYKWSKKDSLGKLVAA